MRLLSTVQMIPLQGYDSLLPALSITIRSIPVPMKWRDTGCQFEYIIGWASKRRRWEQAWDSFLFHCWLAWRMGRVTTPRTQKSSRVVEIIHSRTGFAFWSRDPLCDLLSRRYFSTTLVFSTLFSSNMTVSPVQLYLPGAVAITTINLLVRECNQPSKHSASSRFEK